MIGNKIKALLQLNNKKTQDICETLDILDAAYYRKNKNNTFSTEELIKIAKLTSTKLAFVDKEGKIVISFDEEDLRDFE